MGSSRPLDFGHWAAHKLEQLTDYELRHGEAVAIGIALDTTYSYHLGLLDKISWQRVMRLISTLGLELYSSHLEQQHNGSSAILAGLEEFREHLGGQLTIMLIEQIGKGIEVHEMDQSLILQSIGTLKELQMTYSPG